MLEAVVLSRRNFRESDVLVSFYTKERGKVEALARGVKKITSKNAPLLEPFSCVSVGLVPGKEIDVITTTQSVAYFSLIRKDIQKALAAQQAVSWMESTIALHEKDVIMYDLLYSWLTFVNASEYKGILLDAFFMKLMIRLGFQPQLDVCMYCQKSLDGEEKIFFSFPSGGVVCRADKISNNETDGAVLDKSLLLGLRYLLSGSWREISAFENVTLYQSLHPFVVRYMSYYTEKKVSNSVFFEDIKV